MERDPQMATRSSTSFHIPLYLAILGALLMSGCVHRKKQIKPVDLLTVLAKRLHGRSPSDQREAMVNNIRAELRAIAPTADTTAFERALIIVGTLPREEFVRDDRRNAAYVDLPQEIGYGQTISDPYVVTIMTAALDLPVGANVLDVGTGSGYQAAVLARTAKRVSSIEIVPALALSASERLRRLGFSNVEVRAGDGFLGWPEHAPFDGIIVAASAPDVPSPLLDQLKPGGRIVMPIGPSDKSTQLIRFTKKFDGSVERCSLGDALFVPLTGARVRPFARYGLFDRSIPLCFGSPIVGIL